MEKQLKEAIESYRIDYIRTMRQTVGHAPLMTTACGVIIENQYGEILLQRRSDNGCWGLPGGAMELGEKFINAAKREVLEETGIEVDNLRLFGIYSGEDRIITYPNGDICCVTSIVFRTTAFHGPIKQSTEEAIGHAFFRRDALPENINGFDRRYLVDWCRCDEGVVID